MPTVHLGVADEGGGRPGKSLRHCGSLQHFSWFIYVYISYISIKLAIQKKLYLQ